MQINCLLLGDTSVGKSAFVERSKTGLFLDRHQPTITNFTQILYETTSGSLQFNLIEGYLNVKIDCAIIFFDVTNLTSFENIEKYFAMVPKNTPILICGNKVDKPQRLVKPKKINKEIKKFNTQYYEFSCKSNYNFYKPFNYFIDKICLPETRFISDYIEPPVPVDLEFFLTDADELND